MQALTGQLLLAGPSLWDPNFRRAVVLIGHHDDEGAVGVILNRSLHVPVREVVPALGGLVGEDASLFAGGPVEPEGVVVVADFVDPSIAEVIAFGTVGFLPPEPDVGLEDVIRCARVFAGYAGWGAGQLEAELDEDSWVLEPALAGDVFHPEPDRLWDHVLRRKGRSFDLMRLMPVDPSMN